MNSSSKRKIACSALTVLVAGTSMVGLVSANAVDPAGGGSSSVAESSFCQKNSEYEMVYQSNGIQLVSKSSGEKTEIKLKEPLLPSESVDVDLHGFSLKLVADFSTGNRNLPSVSTFLNDDCSFSVAQQVNFTINIPKEYTYKSGDEEIIRAAFMKMSKSSSTFSLLSDSEIPSAESVRSKISGFTHPRSYYDSSEYIFSRTIRSDVSSDGSVSRSLVPVFQYPDRRSDEQNSINVLRTPNGKVFYLSNPYGDPILFDENGQIAIDINRNWVRDNYADAAGRELPDDVIDKETVENYAFVAVPVPLKEGLVFFEGTSWEASNRHGTNVTFITWDELETGKYTTRRGWDLPEDIKNLQSLPDHVLNKIQLPGQSIDTTTIPWSFVFNNSYTTRAMLLQSPGRTKREIHVVKHEGQDSNTFDVCPANSSTIVPGVTYTFNVSLKDEDTGKTVEKTENFTPSNANDCLTVSFDGDRVYHGKVEATLFEPVDNETVRAASSLVLADERPNEWVEFSEGLNTTFGSQPDISFNPEYGTPEISYEGVDGTVYGPSDKFPENAGKYKARVRVARSVGEYSGLDDEVSFSIDKAENEWVATPEVKVSEDDGKVSVSDVEARFGDVKTEFFMKGSDTPLEGAPSKPGEYTAVFTVDETGNYTGLSKSIEFSVPEPASSVAPINDTTVKPSTGSNDTQGENRSSSDNKAEKNSSTGDSAGSKILAKTGATAGVLTVLSALLVGSGVTILKRRRQ